jgi:hypothetical protein
MTSKRYMICPIGNNLGNLWEIKQRCPDLLLLEKVYNSRSEFDSFFDTMDNQVIVKLTRHEIEGTCYYQYHIKKDDKWLCVL